MARAIAEHNPSKLFLASRTKEKLEQVAQEIYDVSPKAKSFTELVPLDLSSQHSI
jgi:short-subunit dehydrogenase